MSESDQEERLRHAFHERFGEAPTTMVRAPGRVTLLGAHIDYSEGPILAATLDRAVWLATSPREDGRLRAVALDLGDEAATDLATANDQGFPWLRYPLAVAWALRQQGFSPRGLNAVYGGNLPRGAGVSSSAAVEVAFLLAWRRLGELALDRIEIARLARRAENDFLGVQSGIMDPFTSLHGSAQEALYLDCRDLSFRTLPLPPGTAVLVADSGVRRRLGDASGAGFNDRREACRQAVVRLQEVLPEIRTLRDLTEEDYALHSHHLPMELRRRARHGVEEMARVRAGALALTAGDLGTFGHLMRQSHLSSRDLYEVSLPELDLLAATAWATPGCWGARLSGGGFGGCVTVLIQETAATPVAEALRQAFQGAFGRAPEIHLCRIAAGATL
jgi:galactokinase